MEKVTLTIPNISCHHCVNTIKHELLDLPGVKHVTGDPQTKQVIVEFEAPAGEETILNLLKEINYPAM